MSYKKKQYKNIICQNCGKKGHHIKSCQDSITSIGIILYINLDKIIKYLMICRRNSIGFVEFIRGRYIKSDLKYIQKLIDVMSVYEIKILLDNDFDYLWEQLWLDNKFKKKNNRIQRDYKFAKDKFLKLKNGYFINNIKINLKYFINKKSTIYNEPEWGFPKGRRNNGETNIQTAIREFKEETNLNSDEFVINSDKIFIEEYKSYDNVKYKNIYYLAEYIGQKKEFKIDVNKKEQFSEISKIEFLSLEDSINFIRDYNIEKKQIIRDVHNYLT